MKPDVGTRRSLPLWALVHAVMILVAGAASNASAVTTGNLLTDPSFEANSLIPFVDILTPPFTTNAWGGENSAITGPASGITPAQGSLMLSMSDDGLVATQAWQLIDVSAFSLDINASLVTADATALYNVPADISTALSSLNIQFLDSSYATIGGGANAGSPILDNNVNTWEAVSITSALLPVGTQYLRTQVAYGNASMISSNGVRRPGYVDAALLTLTTAPEPSALLLGVSSLVAILIRRKQSV